MPNRLKDKVAVITAAGQGIGRAIAEAFIAEGALVIASDLDAGKLTGLAAKMRQARRALDRRRRGPSPRRSKTSARRSLVNCAGYVHQGSVLECSEQDWDFSFDLNVKSMHRMIRAYLPAWRRRAAARSSTCRRRSPRSAACPTATSTAPPRPPSSGSPRRSPPTSSKQGIRANAICPGTIQSPSLDGRIWRRKRRKSQDDVRQAFVDRQPMGRLGTAQEVAALALFLASDESSYITGQAHLVDGGMAL